MLANDTMQDLVNDILSTFDFSDQYDILQEECAELIQAVSKHKRARSTVSTMQARQQIVEEMSHVLISISVVARLCSIEPCELIEEINKKANKYGFRRIEENDHN